MKKEIILEQIFMEQIRKKSKMIRDIKAYNKNYRIDYLDSKTLRELLPLCHPLDREDHLKDILKLEELIKINK